MGFCFLPNDKKCGRRVVSGQNPQESRGGGRVGTIVKGKGHLGLSGIAPADHRQKKADGRDEWGGKAGQNKNGQGDGGKRGMYGRHQDCGKKGQKAGQRCQGLILFP